MASAPVIDAPSVKAVAIFEVSAIGQALRLLASFAEAKNTIPILANVHVLVRGGTAVLSVTNLSYWLSVTVPIADGDDMEFTASAHLLANLIGNFPNGAQAKLTWDGSKIAVTAGRARYTLATLPSRDWPVMPLPEDAAAFAMDAAQIRQVIGDIDFAMANEEARYYLNGIYVHRVDGANRMGMAATNGLQLAVCEMPMPKGAEDIDGSIIHRKCVSIIGRMLDGHEGDAEIALAKGKIMVRAGQIELRAKLVDGQYPAYWRIIPQHYRAFEADADDFAAALARVLLIVEGKSSAVLLTFTEGLLAIRPRGFGLAEGTEEIAVDYGDEPFEIAINGVMLRDTLKVLKGSVIRMEMPDVWDESAPMLLRAVADARATYLVTSLKK